MDQQETGTGGIDQPGDQGLGEVPQEKPPTRLYARDTFTRNGHTFRVEFPRDDDMGEPWTEHDGHGIVSEWTTRKKRPGERILVEDRNSRRYYDVRASLELARRDGWGPGYPLPLAGHGLTPKQIAVLAVERDYQYLKDWCEDRWEWIGVVVTRLEEGKPTPDRASLWGIESSEENYLAEVAWDLAGEIEITEPCTCCKGSGRQPTKETTR